MTAVPSDGNYTMSPEAAALKVPYIHRSLEALMAVTMDSSFQTTVEIIASVCSDALRGGHQILLAGNGGSAAQAQHLAAELVGVGYAALALTADSAVLTALSNDNGYSMVFERQIHALGEAGDVLMLFSTSGTSRNVWNAAHLAREMDITTVGFTGKQPSLLRETGPLAALLEGVCDHVLLAPAQETQIIQDIHQIALHAVFELIVEVM